MGTILSIIALVVLLWFFIYGFWKGWIRMFIKIGLFAVSLALAFFLMDTLYPTIGGFNCFWSSGNTFEEFFITSCTDWVSSMVEGASQAVSGSLLTEENCKEIAVNQAGLPEACWSWAWASIQPIVEGLGEGGTAVPAEVVGQGMGVAVTKLFVFVVSFLGFRIILGIAAFIVLFILNIIIRYTTKRGFLHRLISGAFGLVLGAAVLVGVNLVMHLYSSVEPLNAIYSLEDAIGVNNESDNNLAKWLYNSTEGLANSLFKLPETPEYPDPTTSGDQSGDSSEQTSGQSSEASEGQSTDSAEQNSENSAGGEGQLYIVSIPSENLYPSLAA